MAFVQDLMVSEVATVSGTGSITLLGPSGAYRRTFVSGIGVGNTVRYQIYDAQNNEIGIGTVNVIGGIPQLSRDTVEASTNNKQLVNFPAEGTKMVRCVAQQSGATGSVTPPPVTPPSTGGSGGQQVAVNITDLNQILLNGKPFDFIGEVRKNTIIFG